MARRDGCGSARSSIYSPRLISHTILALSGLWRRRKAASACQPLGRIGLAHELAAAVRPLLDLDLVLGEALRPDQDLPGSANEVGGGEFRARPLVEVVIEHVDALGGEFPVKPLAAGLASRPPLVDLGTAPRGGPARLRILGAAPVGTPPGGGAPRRGAPPPKGPAGAGASAPVGPRHDRLHRPGIFGAEIEDLAYLDAARA